MTQYAAADTPRGTALQDTGDLHLQQERMRQRVEFDQRRRQSELSSFARDVDGVRAVARVYVPSAQEKTRAALDGRWGVCLEVINFALSVIIFSLYIAELYDNGVDGSVGGRSLEICATLFFIFDLALHLFAAPNPWSYLLSPHGIIDLLTIIPSVIVLLMPATRTQLFFVLRVLRIFRALRVLRLKQFIRFKKSKFDYELAVFIMSSIAVVLCAAGMFHAFEESYYISRGESLKFHQALYFVLVTTATIGYGDISPRTAMGQVFVIVLIIGIFTVVPHEVSKLNRLAKQSHDWDKDYVSKSNASGHVIVSGFELTTDTALDFLREFYHESRGNIHLDVVFLSDTPPTRELSRILATEKYRWRTSYLRGSLTNSADQRRVQLGNTTAVFLLANKRLSCDPVEQDATTILHTLSVRNFADSYGKIVGIYTQLLSHQEQHEMTSLFLGANATRTSKLRTMILARSAVCPGASTLILNLLQSVGISDYSKRQTWGKLWIQEYLDGMCHQLFPMIFTDKFQFEKFEDVARNVFEHYGVILLTVYDKKAQRMARTGNDEDSAGGSTMPVAPFQTYICEGDIGFVIAKSASVVLHIVTTYGFWQDEGEASNDRVQGSSSIALPVRVSSDTLMRRPSPKNTFRQQSARVSDESSHDRPLCSSIGSRGAGARERKWRELNSDHTETIAWGGSQADGYSGNADSAPLIASLPIRMALGSIDEGRMSSSSLGDAPIAHGSRVVEAAKMKDADQVLDALKRDHFRADMQHVSDHYVVCSSVLSDALDLVKYLRRFNQHEHERRWSTRTPAATLPMMKESQQLSALTWNRCFVLLVETFPNVTSIMDAIEESDSGDRVLESVYFVCGSSSKTKDLARAGAPRARHVVIFSGEQVSASSPAQAECDIECSTNDDENRLADYGVICSMLALEIARQQQQQQLRLGASKRSPVSPRRLRARRSLSISELGVGASGANVEVTAPSYQRELEQGLPIESVKLRMLERFPDLDPAVFREKGEVIEARLHRQLDAEHSQSVDAGSSTSYSASDAASIRTESTLGVIQHTNNARFCRPRDHEVCHDEFPYLAPSYASGNIFLSSLLDRIVCQSFYNPYITDLVESLAAGSTKSPALTMSSNRQPHGHGLRDGHHARLFRIKVDEVFVGGKFLDVFVELLRLDILAIGILRYPDPVLENLLPYVYTCPDPETVLRANDRLFVVG